MGGSTRIVEHTLTDATTRRTFNLTIQGGNILLRLQELTKNTPQPKWEDVPQTTLDGAMWWDQWEGEVDAGAFNPSRNT